MAVLDRDSNAWNWVQVSEDVRNVQSSSLPADFNWDGTHTIRIENNRGRFTALLDGVAQPDFTILATAYSAGTPGLFAGNHGGVFEHFIVTRGWDEWGNHLRGWDVIEGEAAVQADGLHLAPGARVLKGDLLNDYEFNIQFSTSAECDVYPVHIDPRNHLRLRCDRTFEDLLISGVRDGVPLEELRLPVAPRINRAHLAANNGNNLRVVKRDDAVIVFAEGKELLRLRGAWPASRVAVGSRAGVTVLHAVTVFELP